MGSYFWTLAYVNPESMWPKNLINYYPTSYYHLSHTTQLVTSFIELIILVKTAKNGNKFNAIKLRFLPKDNKSNSKCQLESLTGLYGLPVFFSYNLWIITIHHFYHEWPYEFLENLWNSPFCWKYGVFAVTTWTVSVIFAEIFCAVYNLLIEKREVRKKDN